MKSNSILASLFSTKLLLPAFVLILILYLCQEDDQPAPQNEMTNDQRWEFAKWGQATLLKAYQARQELKRVVQRLDTEDPSSLAFRQRLQTLYLEGNEDDQYWISRCWFLKHNDPYEFIDLNEHAKEVQKMLGHFKVCHRDLKECIYWHTDVWQAEMANMIFMLKVVAADAKHQAENIDRVFSNSWYCERADRAIDEMFRETGGGSMGWSRKGGNSKLFRPPDKLANEFTLPSWETLMADVEDFGLSVRTFRNQVRKNEL